MIRRTKIVTTLGPATDRDDELERLILAGANVVRLNFSHGEADDHRQRIQKVRQLASKLKRSVAVLGDLQGPKIRIARFREGAVHLEKGQCFTLDNTMSPLEGDVERVGLDYEGLPNEVSRGDRLLLDDGRLILQVEAVVDQKIETQVVVGGRLSNNKGINKEGGGLSAPALTEKDFCDIKLAAEIGVDFLAVSFVRSVDDIERAREALRKSGSDAHIVAKIERAEAVADYELLDDIILASDAIMVARGDLGVEIGDAALVAVQKYMIQKSRELNRTVITATQMMESMVENCLPTRAEVFDVANAVLDGTDAVMLSAETAAGKYPVEAVEAMDRIIAGAESHPSASSSEHRLHQDFKAVDESIAMAVMYTANHLLGVKAIISMTETGNTPLLTSRINSKLPIFAFTRHEKTENRVALYRGVMPITFDINSYPKEERLTMAINNLRERQLVNAGDLVIVTVGDCDNVHGSTNTMKVLSV
ncbi:pyruvate kinase [uncultured Pseudoteredinibacter sp.]|uniref:pyruvate kinase n=1 Tax=uncultured Pseudoteredinibacter sp. TaxID=1641701 RepID=UPI00261C1638|nr:pyruvate kinase [uncultured Pseudoteredinibacter sp.]